MGERMKRMVREILVLEIGWAFEGKCNAPT
jgi:hypothetical protein